MAVEKRKRKGFDYLSILILGEGAPTRAFSMVSHSVSWSLIPQGPPFASEKTIGEKGLFAQGEWR